MWRRNKAKNEQAKDGKSSEKMKKDSKRKKDKKVKKIYTPRPGGVDSDEDEHACEEQKLEEKPWLKHFTEAELYGRYVPSRELGRGSYGVVYEGQVLVDNEWGLKAGTKVAIKKVRRVFHTETDAKRLLREIRILRSLKDHDCCVKLYDILPPTDPKHFATLILIFEFVDADLGKIFRTNQYFTTLHVQYMLYQCLLGIKYMHSARIVHRDLKPANILINEDCSIKLCDFGLARGFNEDHTYKDPPPDAEEPPKEEVKPKERKSRKKLLTNPRKQKPGSNKDEKAENDRKKLKRDLTRHVVTRWYRAPEVILLQQKKDKLTAVDMWSIGCIFAELLQMQKDNCPDPSRRGPIFPGDSCFPLSVKDQFDYASRLDQMQVIFEKIGTPTKEEVEKIDDPKARKYLYGLPVKKQKNLKRKYPGCPPEGIDLLLRLLQFDVDKRISVEDAILHPYLEPVRDPAHEKSLEETMNFSFEGQSLTMKNLRALILNESMQYNMDRKEAWIKCGALDSLPKDL